MKKKTNQTDIINNKIVYNIGINMMDGMNLIINKFLLMFIKWLIKFLIRSSRMVYKKLERYMGRLC
jgi:hypothetical protein